jgi:hypothetical protein
MSGVSFTDLLAEYSIGYVNHTHLFVWKVPFEVPHDCAAALFMVGMYFWDPFFDKKEVTTRCFVKQYPSSPLLASSNAPAESF